MVQMACVWEACAPKPGNVSRCHSFSDTSLEDFLISAVAIGPAFENAAQGGIGQIIWQATVNTRQWVQSNTNLGIILLLAPLAKACLTTTEIIEGETLLQISMGNVRQNLGIILSALTMEDARQAYAAIRLAQPGGLGQVSQSDIAEEPSLTLLQAMALAKDRDSIAREYVTDYAITFETGLPALKEALFRGGDFSSAVVQAFLAILSRTPDTLIARKKGSEAASQVSQWAREALTKGGIFTPQGRAALTEMDRALCDANHTLNPGTTADLTTAAIFLALLEAKTN